MSAKIRAFEFEPDETEAIAEYQEYGIKNADATHTRRLSVSKSGRIKQIVKHREALDKTLFNDHDQEQVMNGDQNNHKSNGQFDKINDNSNNYNKTISNNSNSTLSRKSYTETEIEAWIENSFQPTFDGYKTIRRRSTGSITSITNTIVDSDGHLETAL